MRRLLPLIAILALMLALPAGSQARGGLAGKLAAKTCAQEKKAIGTRAFAKKYGRRAMPACIKKQRAGARKAIQVATEECQAELDDFGLADFLEDWESFEECVAGLAELELGDDPADGSGDDDIGDEIELD